MGSRFTQANVLCEVDLEEEFVYNSEGELVEDMTETTDKPVSRFVYGEAAKKSLLRSKVTLANKGDINDSESVLSYIGSSDKSLNKCGLKFFTHLKELAYETSGLGATKSDRLRVVLTTPENSTKETVDKLLVAARTGFGKKANIIGIVNEHSAICTAHGLTGNHLQGVESVPVEYQNWRNAVIVNWGAKGLSCGIVKRVGESDIVECSSTSVVSTAHSGEKIVQLVMDHCQTFFLRKSKLNIYESTKAIGRLRVACEIAVRSLARGKTCTVEADGIMEGEDLRVPVSKPRFDMMCSSLVESGEEFIQEYIKSQKIDEFQICLKAGAVCEMPSAAEMIDALFADAWKGLANVAVDEAVAIGASIHAAMLVESGVVKVPNDIKMSLSEEIEVVDTLNIGVSRSVDGKLVGDVVSIVSPGTPVGVELSRVVTGNVAGQDIVLVDLKNKNDVIAKIGDVVDGDVRVNVVVGKEGGLTIKCLGAEFKM